jgi:hypothetical protein
MLAGTSAFAATKIDYAAMKAAIPPVALAVDEALTRHAGQVIELDGIVGTINATPEASGFTLQRAGGTVLTVHGPVDADLRAGTPVRVLGRVYDNGSDVAALITMPTTVATTVAKAAVPVKAPVKTVAKAAPAKVKKTVRSSRNVSWYASRIRAFSGGISSALATRIATAVVRSSARHGVDARLVCALIAQESRFNPRAVSPVGARGLGQLMPGTAAQLGVRDPFNIEQNVEGTVRYLAAQIRSFGSVNHALAAYNAGPGNVQRFGGVPPFRETRNYVRVISQRYAAMVQNL